MYKTIDLFAGIGGIRRGYEMTGKFENVLSAEIDKYACITYEHLYGENPCNDVTSEEFKEKVAKYNVLGVEMESFALFTNAKLLNKKAATLLMVSDSFIYPDKLSSLEREQGLDNLITLALETSLKL